MTETATVYRTDGMALHNEDDWRMTGGDMTRYKRNFMAALCWLAASWVATGSAFAHAQPTQADSASVVVSFHMGLGGEDRFAWGGTIENKTTTTTGPVVVAITPIDGSCKVGAVSTFLLPELGPNEKRQVRVPLNVTSLHHYRVLVQAYDTQGFALTTADLSQALLDARVTEEHQFCDAQTIPHK